MNEHNPLNKEQSYRIDDSSHLSILKKQDDPNPPKNENNDTKLFNRNDFIFRQYLEFYPNLANLSCKDGILSLKENGEIIASESLTFDLRTLPGEARNVDAQTFMEIIKINKSCDNLNDFIKLLNQNAFNNFTIDKESLDNKVTNYMNLYFSIKDSFHYLTEDNKILIGTLETLIATLPKETLLGSMVNQKLDEYFEITKQIGDSKGKDMVLELKSKNVPTLIEEDVPARSSKAAFVNIAIIIYGVLNIGFILAIALLK